MLDLLKPFREAAAWWFSRPLAITRLRGRLAWWLFGLALRLAGDNDRIASALMRRRADEIERRALSRLRRNIMADIRDVETTPEAPASYRGIPLDASRSGGAPLRLFIPQECLPPSFQKRHGVPSTEDLNEQWRI